MKAYTDIKQSKKLAEILPIESADMGWYYSCNPRAASNQMWVGTKSENADIPCWSLSALLDNIPQVKLDSIIQSNEKLWRCLSYFKSEWNESIWCNNPVDACYEMIIKLNEQKTFIIMKYIEEYLKDIIKVKPLGKLTTKEDELDGMSGEMVYIDGKCSNIFISHADYANWLEKQGEKETDEWKEGNIIRHGGILALVIRGRRVMKSNGEIFTVQYPDEWVKAAPKEIEHFLNEFEKQGGKPQGKTALLFAKMKDAGYEWDSNRKELIKIEQKLSNSAKIGMDEESKWTEEDEQYLLVCKNALHKYQWSDKWDADIISKWLEDKLKQRMEE